MFAVLCRAALRREYLVFTCSLAAKTDVGLVRATNEDAFLCVPEANLFAICDGMGGEQAGEIASQLASEMIREAVCRGSIEEDDEPFPAGVSDAGKLLIMAVRAANRAIHLAAEQSPEHKGMGTTAAVVLIGDDTATIANVGDSRVYLVRNGAIQALTQDHSVVAEQVRAGIITEEMGRQSPYQHYLTRALGPRDVVQADVTEVLLEDGDLFLLATDGLVGAVEEPDIVELVADGRALDHACVSLIEAAKHNGSTDNITCILVKVSAEAAKDVPTAVHSRAHPAGH